ncbi:endopeptidase La [Treponema pedis]|uniref:Lon protease n=1 Tax=Treponema pedis str. T A4 TaxID=1291379 RepID=S5ZQV9_9SPIR|nr:endopeptidase La [Treponema pedis]AGT45052.1 ATP-dependent protease La [Treponema pedis str. T A4]QSI05661.1 endopeptidase La [Treponema pedis]
MAKTKEIIPIEQLMPQKLNLLPLAGRPIFPGIFTPFLINSPEDIKSLEEAYNGDGFIGLCLLKKETENPSVNDLYKIGSVAKIVRKINLPDGGLNVFIATQKRFKIRKVISDANPMTVIVQYLEEEMAEDKEFEALTRALISEVKVISENNPLFSEEMRLNMANINHPGRIADFTASILNISKEDQQKILEILNVKKRMEEVFIHIKKEQDLLKVQRKIQEDLNVRIEKNQREYFLTEELKSIKKELGITTDPKIKEEEKFEKLIKEFNFTGEVKEAVDSEFEKFKMLEPHSSEYVVTRNYLETILSLPWKNSEPEDYNLEKAEKILNKEHYGLDDVKERILEYLAVRKLKNDTKGSIILLVGPPGVGKTSVGMSIAHAMNKPFFRFSVGGMKDEGEIKGHRRTYIGAMPGKILQGLKVVKTNSPVFMIDEIDKMGYSHQGDPSSALLEVLDPEQNINFRDHYLDLPFDLSNIVFILTANTPDSIPRPLLDRTEVIKLSGYIDSEKVQIAKKHLIPKSLKNHGLKKEQVSFSREILLYIANAYAREAGVRNFEKNIDKIHRKIAAKIVGNKIEEDEKIVVTKEIIEEMLGKPIFRDDDIKKADKAGTSIGLAWTSMGGDTLLIESASMPGKPVFKMTGQAGDVMKESAGIALSWTRMFSAKNKIKPPEWFERHIIHLHLPEGATPKDGPSAGITMATALLSLFSGKTIKQNLAMTGELSLTGQVLAIGGLKEKTIAARRNGIKDIIIPQANVRDLDEIPDYVKKGIKFHSVSRIEEVIEIAFEGKLPAD